MKIIFLDILVPRTPFEFLIFGLSMFAFVPMGILHEIFHHLVFQKYGIQSIPKINKTILLWEIFRTDTNTDEFMKLNLKKQRNILFSGSLSELAFISIPFLIIYYNLLPSCLGIVIFFTYVIALIVNLIDIEISGASSDMRIYLQLKKGNYERVRELLSKNDV